MFLPKNAEKIIELLENSGHKAYAVGGCVRDFLLKRQTFDYDITTSATPLEVKSALAPIKVFETGLKHGTVTAILENERFEITTFRTESQYKDHRHPECVCFSKRIEDDLMRRDFTINAIAYSQKEGFIDNGSGIDDLKNGIIRAVGNAQARFNEDALRILRGLRFASVLGFSLEEETKNAIKTCFPLLSFISKERIFDEIKKILCGKNAETVLSEFCEVFDFVFESDFSQKGVDSLPPDFALRFAFIFRQNPNSAQTALISLKADNKTKSEVKAILKNLANLCCAERTDLKRLLSDCGFETLQKSILISGNLSLLPVLKDIEKRGDCVRISDLAINGGDLLSLNIEPKNICGVLSEILNLVIDGKLENSKEDILGYLKKTL